MKNEIITMAELREYRNTCKVAVRMVRRMESLQRTNGQSFRDKVRGSMPYFPYTEASFGVTGRVRNALKIQELGRALKERLDKAQALLVRINAFLETIPPEHEDIREAIVLHYIDGMTYMETAECMGMLGDGSTQMKAVHAYMKRCASFPGPL